MSSLGCDCTGRLSTKSEGGNGLRLCGGLVGRNSPYDDFRMQRMITSHDVMSKIVCKSTEATGLLIGFTDRKTH